MELSWKDYLKLNWPFVCIFAFFLVSSLYACGFEAGKKAILEAAHSSAKECK